MDQTLRQDIVRFFGVFNSRTEDILRQLSPSAKSELDEELSLLMKSVLNRLAQEQR